jgi:hypothetical protein
MVLTQGQDEHLPPVGGDGDLDLVLCKVGDCGGVSTNLAGEADFFPLEVEGPSWTWGCFGLLGRVFAFFPCADWGRPAACFFGPRLGSQVLTSMSGWRVTPEGPALMGAGSGEGPLLGRLGSRPRWSPRGGDGSLRGARRSKRAVVTRTGETETILWSLSILGELELSRMARMCLEQFDCHHSLCLSLKIYA